jgi:flagellar assembly protein FliH
MALEQAVKDEISVRGIELFEYPDSPDAPFVSAWNEEKEEGESRSTAPARRMNAKGVESAAPLGMDKSLAEETRRSFEAGRQRGVEEGRQAEREAQTLARKETEQRRAQQVAGLIERFAAERDRYLHAVEQEVVKLALAVAARILRREAQMDPLLLTGAVRVALGQLSASTEVRLHAPAAEFDLWKEAIALLPNLNLKAQVTPDEALRLGDCVIETKLGSVDLGIRAQLAEIERGFFDRVGEVAPAAPASSSAAPATMVEAHP